MQYCNIRERPALTSLVNCYEQADALRKEILTRPLASANSSVLQLQKALQHLRAIEAVSELQSKENGIRGGLLSDDTIGQAKSLLKILDGK